MDMSIAVDLIGQRRTSPVRTRLIHTMIAAKLNEIVKDLTIGTFSHQSPLSMGFNSDQLYSVLVRVPNRRGLW